MLKYPEYITESQGNLVIKILKENLEHLNFLGQDLIILVKHPNWKNPFRIKENTRKLSISLNGTGEKVLNIEYSFDRTIREAVFKLQKNIEGNKLDVKEKFCYIDLTERNLVYTVDTLKKFKFKISQEILDLYDDITSIKNHEVVRNFEFENLKNEKFKKYFIEDVGSENINDRLLIHDRKIKFQYYFDEDLSNYDCDDLTKKIALRTMPDVFIDKKTYDLSSIFTSLKRLKRFPLMVILNKHDVDSCITSLNEISQISNMIFKIGVYFRFNNDEIGSVFNKTISQLGYNEKLDRTTDIAILNSYKIPKLLLNSGWSPKSVIYLDNSIVSGSKISIYSNNCDLVIDHSNLTYNYSDRYEIL